MGSRCNSLVYTKNTVISIDITEFAFGLNVIPFHGANLVLNVEWLKTLRPITFDYQKMTISFNLKGLNIIPAGVTPYINLICPLQLRYEVTNKEVHSLLVLRVSSPNSMLSVNNPARSLAIQSILDDFHDLFSKPTGLPPIRATDHIITI